MIPRSIRIGLALGLISGLALLLVKRLSRRSEPETRTAPSEPWPRLASDPAQTAPPTVALVPDPAAPALDGPVIAEAAVAPVAGPQPVAEAPSVAGPAAGDATTQAPTRTWVEPEGTVCPSTHPVKAKLASRIFHLPGMINYGRTKPDRCYKDAATAEADGLRLAKR